MFLLQLKKTALSHLLISIAQGASSHDHTALTQLRDRCCNHFLSLSFHVRNFMLIWETRSPWVGFAGLKGVEKAQEIRLTITA